MMKITADKGESIYLVAQRAVALAKKEQHECEFEFNDIKILATPSSNPDDLVVIYSLKCQIRRLKLGLE